MASGEQEKEEGQKGRQKGWQEEEKMRPPCKRRAGKCLLVRHMKSRRDSGKVRGVDVGGLKLSSSEREREKERWRKRERGWVGGGRESEPKSSPDWGGERGSRGSSKWHVQ